MATRGRKALSQSPNAIKKRAAYQKRKAGAAPKPQEQAPIPETQASTTPDTIGQPFLSAQEAPPDTFPSGGIMNKILGKLGLQEEAPEDQAKPATAPPMAGPLSKKRQEFVDNMTPVAALMLVGSLAWAWGQLGTPYRACAPSEAVATRIVAPLLRIYARTAKFIESLDPNSADWLAALSAIIGYAFASIETFQIIRAQIIESELTDEPARTSFPNAHQNGHRVEDNRRAPVEQSLGQSSSEHVTSANGVNPTDLSPGERAHYEALSRLRERDIAARLRRSGQYGLS